MTIFLKSSYKIHENFTWILIFLSDCGRMWMKKPLNIAYDA
jgi:hypothetical protein